jgi:hypothetical protein
MIEMKFTDPQNGRVEAFLTEAGPQWISALTKRMYLVMRKLANYIQAEKLSGQVLHVRTGNLRRGLGSTPHAELDGSTVVGIVGIPREAWYGKVHELGAHIPAVDGQLMVFRAPNPGISKRTLTNKVFTTKHRAFELPERSFLRVSLMEKQTDIFNYLDEALKQEVEKQNAG